MRSGDTGVRGRTHSMGADGTDDGGLGTGSKSLGDITVSDLPLRGMNRRTDLNAETASPLA